MSWLFLFTSFFTDVLSVIRFHIILSCQVLRSQLRGHYCWDVIHPLFKAHSSSRDVPQRYSPALVAVSSRGTASLVGSSRFKNKQSYYWSDSACGRVVHCRIQEGHSFWPAGPPVPSHINVMSSLELDCYPLSELYKFYGVPTELEILIPTPSENPWDAFTVLWFSMSLSFYVDFRLLFPLHKLLVSDYKELNIAFTQLTPSDEVFCWYLAIDL